MARTFRHGANLVRSRDDGAGTALQLLFDNGHGCGFVASHLALQVVTAITRQLTSAGNAIHRHVDALLCQYLHSLDHFGQYCTRAQQRDLLKRIRAIAPVEHVKTAIEMIATPEYTCLYTLGQIGLGVVKQKDVFQNVTLMIDGKGWWSWSSPVQTGVRMVMA